ncbi:MAG: hypothetical protein GC171_07060 [Terrimonas sp.]|nr:hypothetical protein [Terrimonas sp.]
MKSFFFLLMIGFSQILKSQPYINIFSLQYQHSPDAGMLQRDQIHNRVSYFKSEINLPVVFRRDSSIIVFSPAFEQWAIRLPEAYALPSSFRSMILPVNLIHPLSNKWTVLFAAIPRWNGYGNKWVNNSFQMGAAFLASYKKNKRLQYKLGVYINNEFSGVFIMPLLGIDWQIDGRNNLFGVLPGNLVFEHFMNPHWYWGASFRAITNTYQSGLINPGPMHSFCRIDENQLSLYTDIYMGKNIVLNAEAGHSVFRRFRMGIEDADQKYYEKAKVNDGLLFKIGMAYRLRLR